MGLSTPAFGVLLTIKEDGKLSSNDRIPLTD
jgi:hypothetical protein